MKFYDLSVLIISILMMYIILLGIEYPKMYDEEIPKKENIKEKEEAQKKNPK